MLFILICRREGRKEKRKDLNLHPKIVYTENKLKKNIVRFFYELGDIILNLC